MACSLTVVQFLFDYFNRESSVTIDYGSPSVLGYFKAFALVAAAMEGASSFPSVQADMKEPKKFCLSAIATCTSTYKCCMKPVACHK